MQLANGKSALAQLEIVLSLVFCYFGNIFNESSRTCFFGGHMH